MQAEAEEHLHAMLQQADENLYRAKREGKNKVVL
jgi:PleD family two-component response regulator